LSFAGGESGNAASDSRPWQVLKLHQRIVRSNPVVSICLGMICAVVLAQAWTGHEFLHAVGYLGGIWLSALLTDAVTLRSPDTSKPFICRNPTRESIAAVVFTLIGFVPLVIRFSRWWPLHTGSERIGFSAVLLLFTYPVGLAVLFLARYRYRPDELGVNSRYWYLAAVVNLVMGIITLAVAPSRSHWGIFLHRAGWNGFLTEALLGAALPEEFTRMLLQTRLAFSLNNRAGGFLVATSIWACMHIPNFRAQSPRGAFGGILAAVTIIPLGLLWGYITHRTRSIVPSVLIHGTNLWGLQNF